MSRKRNHPYDGESTDYVEALADLKQQGCNLLVVGESPHEVRHRACRNFLGENSATRRRLFVLTGEGHDLESRLRSSPEGGTIRVVEIPKLVRWQVSDSLSTEYGTARVENERLSDLGRMLSGEILDLQQSVDDDASSWLRICFDSLVPFLDVYEAEPLFRFLRITTNGIADANGMAHFHLPRPADSPEVELVEPLFDAVVELRLGDDGYEQRWNLRDAALASEWHPL